MVLAVLFPFLLASLHPASAMTKTNTKHFMPRLHHDPVIRYYSRIVPIKDRKVEILTADDTLDLINKRNAYNNSDRLWPDGRVPFVFDSNMPAFSKIEVMAAMQEIEVSTANCVAFVPRQSENDYIHLSWVNETFGTTHVGRKGGRQELTINTDGGRGHDDNLFELLILLGLFPEAMRSDRDTYLQVNTPNLMPIAASQYQLLSGQSTSFYGQPFDYESLLLNGPYQGAADGSQPVMYAKQSGHVMGQGVSLTNGDITLVQHTYNCPLDTSNRVNILGSMPINCHFHTNMCTFTQDTQDGFDWKLGSGLQTTAGTGPSADLSSGSGQFALAVATGHHSQVARLVSQQIPAGEYCFRISLYMYGSDMGTFNVTLSHAHGDVTAFSHTGQLRNVWSHLYLQIVSKAAFTIKPTALIGNGDRGDIAIDDVYLYLGKCIEWQ